MTPHPFRPTKPRSNRCQQCGGWAGDRQHILELFTDSDRQRQVALGIQEAQEMTAQLRQPLTDISRATGILERESPLFFGTGANPSLFGDNQ
jgi:hypothetical protein